MINYRTLLHHHLPQSRVVSSVAAALVSFSSSRSYGTDATAQPELSSANLYGLGHALRRNAAGAFGPDLAKKLSQFVKMEKNVMRSLETVAKERMEVAVSTCDTRYTTVVRTLQPDRSIATTLNLGRILRRGCFGRHRQAGCLALRDRRVGGPVR